VEILFEGFEGAMKFAEEVARMCLKTNGHGGCIPESFGGNYRVNNDPGPHFPVKAWEALTSVPFWVHSPGIAQK
jgi:hypothetical protein